ncbi:hypothetical protein ACJIZ3_011867 [Penstemon smallii]|uniref:CRIB domain-containing protein n=1 Tax=Penstemon smallii TaxID=265156 RepID=A0ABD3UNY2_9LAMI
MSSTKMKGLLKGLRYISQIFDEEKESEIQIGFPTDVKHVAHIGWDGPSVDNPSWMKEFKAPTTFQSAPLGLPGDREDPEIKWVSEDTKRSNRAPTSPKSSDLPEVPKSSRRHSASDSTNNTTNDSPRKKDPSTRSRHSRRNHSKDSAEGSVRSKELSLGSDSPSRSLPDIPKKSRRKKSKDSNSGSGSSRTRNKNTASNGTYTSPYSDPGPDTGSILRTQGSQLSPVPSIDDEEKDCRVISKEC